MKLFEKIKTNLETMDRQKLAKLMGYNNPAKFKKRLNKLLFCNRLEEWLETGEYDFVHSNESFVITLCECLSFNEDAFMPEIREARNARRDLTRMPQPYIFVNTHFKRTTEPIFVLAYLEKSRNLSIPKEQVYYSDDEGISMVLNMVKSHYKKQPNGELKLWGKIESYIYHVNHKIIEFDPLGNIIREGKDEHHSQATLFVGSKQLAPEILDTISKGGDPKK
jgi:hypothetical protein